MAYASLPVVLLFVAAMESNLLIRINTMFKQTISVSNWGASFVTILVSSALGNYSNA